MVMRHFLAYSQGKSVGAGNIDLAVKGKLEVELIVIPGIKELFRF